MSPGPRMTSHPPRRDRRLSERVWELDHAIRSALAEQDGETARDLTDRFCALFPALLESAGDRQPALGRRALDLLATQREGAEAQREHIRGELAALARQRHLVEGQRSSRPPQPPRSFTA